MSIPEVYTIFFYCFGLIIPTIMLLYSYGNFAFRIGEFTINNKDEHAMPMILVIILTKLFIISLIMFFTYNYIFENTISDNLVDSTIILFGLLTTFECYLMNKKLVLACRYFRSIVNYKRYIYRSNQHFRRRFKIIFLIKYIIVVALTILFIIGIIKNHFSFVMLLFVTYIYFQYRLNTYIESLAKYNTFRKQ